MVFAKASRLKAAKSGSNGFVMLPSGVTMTRLQSESSSAFWSHLRRKITVALSEQANKLSLGDIILDQSSNISSSAAVWRWYTDFSSFNLEESTSFPLMKSMFPRWRIAATTRNIASYCKKFSLFNQIYTEMSMNTCFCWCWSRKSDYLLFLTDSYNVHGISGFQILPCIINICYFVTVRLIKIVKCSWVS